MAGSVFLLICIFVAVFAYALAPDKSRNANFQVLEFAKKPPGFKGKVLLIPQNGQVNKSSFFNGKESTNIPLALDMEGEIQKNGTYLLFTRYNGIADSIPLIELGGEEVDLEEYVLVKKYHLGTDTFGRDLLSRILIGTRVSLSIGFMAVLISLLIGTLMGLMAGYFGNDLKLGKLSIPVDGIVMWFISVMWSIPTLLLALAISFVLGKGFWQLFLAIGLSIWVEVARLVRGQIMSVKKNLYTEAGKALGYKDFRIMLRHILPNILSPIIVIAVANFGSAVLIESGLSFLGIGVEVPVPTWGQMIYEGYTYIVFDYGQWLAFYPGLALMMLIISVNLIGIGLRDALDVRL
ncbi:MAG: ABC transporter permease [Bacteroidia bacterium]|nr:ABC transporter permease [Bacteroidia bacterium]